MEKSEFLKSTDPLFRPVDMATAPDGTMYIVDMYHGIIQEGQWTPKGSYLRMKIEQYKLDKVVGLGRIWRVSHEGFKRDTKQPRMYDEKSATLVTYLNHPNGWWQDMAQQVLVQRQDKSVVPALMAMALKGTNVNGRIHAIWTLNKNTTAHAANFIFGELGSACSHDAQIFLTLENLKCRL